MQFQEGPSGSHRDGATAGDGQASSSLLHSIGWNSHRSAEFERLGDGTRGLRPARVSRIDGRTCLLLSEQGEVRAEAPRQGGLSPATGDWVVFRDSREQPNPTIEAILERRTTFDRTRQVLKGAVEKQVIVANLDVAFIVHSANNINIRRMEREAAQVASSGAEIAIVVNKADLVEEAEELLEDTRFSLPAFPVHAVSGITGSGVGQLIEYARPDRTIAFIGASGVGKSTLTNRIIGSEIMDTGGVREDDQRGRHTTTARQLVPVPGGGALIDTPGMRSVGLSDDSSGVGAVFGDIEEVAASCRFNDCSHTSEPGCSVQEAIAAGDLDNGRLRSFRKLNRELEFVRSKSDAMLRDSRRSKLKARTVRGRQAWKAREKFGRSQE